MGIEILAPVGNMDMFYAALAAGADAVFLAAKDFGARAYANNFNLDEIKTIVDLCSLRSIRVHVTVNTLIKEGEFDQALELIASLNDLGVDAVIVQDLGLLSLASKRFPDLEFHCSTQLSANNILAVNYLESLGASRVILARELSYEEIKKIKTHSKVDLEVFAHGSICVSYSGKCTMSSFIGGRSGNRGRCAQPCRKEYELLKPSGQILGRGYFLSPMDLATKLGAKALDDLGIKSIKIEGRMKKPEYVYSAVKYYKNLTTGKKASDESLDEVSNRGFTKGIIGQARAANFVDLKADAARGRLVGLIKGKSKKFISLTEDINKRDSLEISLRDKKYTITAAKAYKAGETIGLEKFNDALEGSKVYRIYSGELGNIDFKNKLRKINRPIRARLKAYVGSRLDLVFQTESQEVRVQSQEPIEQGKTSKLDYEIAFKHLGKLGGTDFYLEDLSLDTDGKSFVPASILNDLRREAVEKIYDRISRGKRDLAYTENLETQEQTPRLIVGLTRFDHKILDYDFDDLFLRNLDGARKLGGKKIYYELPMVIKDDEYKEIGSIIEDNLSLIDGLVVSNPWDVGFAKDFQGLEVIVNEYANVFNSYAANTLKKAGASRLVISNELSLKEIGDIKKVCQLSYTLYSRPIEMVMDHCPASLMGCDFICKTCRYSKGHFLKNDQGDTYTFERIGPRTELRGLEALDARSYIKDLEKEGIRSFIYRFNNPEEYKVLEVNNKVKNDRISHLEKGVF